MFKGILATLLLSTAMWAQGGLILSPIAYGSPAIVNATPTLIQGPFMTPNDVANLTPISNGIGGLIQSCFKSTTQVGDTVVVDIITNSTTGNTSLTDDGSSSNTYAIPSGATETAGGQMHSLYVATVSHTSRCVNVSFASSTGVTNNQVAIWDTLTWCCRHADLRSNSD